MWRETGSVTARRRGSGQPVAQHPQPVQHAGTRRRVASSRGQHAVKRATAAHAASTSGDVRCDSRRRPASTGSRPTTRPASTRPCEPFGGRKTAGTNGRCAARAIQA